MVDFSKYKTKETTTSGVTDFSKYASNQVNAEELALDGFANIEPNYFQRVGGQYQKAGQDIMGAISTGAESLQKADGSLQSLLQPVRTALRTVGGVAGAAFAPILEAPLIKPLTEKIVGRVAENPEVASVIKSATELSQKYPGASKDLQNIFDIATLGYGKTVESPLKKELGAIGGDIAEATKIVLTPSEEAVQKKVVSLFNKSIKPTAKKTLAQGQRYENDTLNALRTIKTNTPSLNILDDTGELIEGRTPQTIQELAQGLDQTKDIVFKQYDDLAKQAGTSGAVIDAKPIADEVAKVAQNKALQLTNPDIIKYAEQWSERLRAFDVLDTETTQEVIKLMNNNLQSFYKNPTYDTASKVAVDAGIANNFRQALDKAIEGATGEQYQVLKNQYSALKAIENDVVRASMREARKNTKGLIDYTDILTSGQMVAGILSLSPAMFTKGAIERGFKEYIKFLNDPNRAIKNIFDKLDSGRSTTFNPASETGKFLKNPKLGMSINDVTKDIPPAYKGEKDLTTKILKDLEGKSTVSKQYILDATNRGELKQVERDLIRQALETEGNTVNVNDFAKKVKAELLPLKRESSMADPGTKYSYGYGGNLVKYEGISLPNEIRGAVKNYSENIYESPIKTSAGQTHFSGQSENYFGHTRIEDMADNKTRRVIEVQSDLYQKGNLDKEFIPTGVKIGGDVILRGGQRESVVRKLQQYNDPTAHFRMIREEIKKAAQDGKTKLQFPTGETAMKIEGLGQATDRFSVEIRPGTYAPNGLTKDLLDSGKVGVGKEIRGQDGAWIITDVLGDGKFKAVPKSTADMYKFENGKFVGDVFDNTGKKSIGELPEHNKETFDISGKVDTNNPIYKFYEKEVQKYLNKFGGKRVVDDKGVSWIEIPITKEQGKMPVEAFGLVGALGLGAYGQNK